MVRMRFLSLAFIAAFLLLLPNMLFTVNQRHYAVIFQFGEAVRTIEEPGLKIMLPFIQKVQFFEKRLLNITAEAKELTASDGKRVIVDAFAKFRIKNPVQFYKTVYNYESISIRVTKILESSMRKVIGRVPLIKLLSNERINLMLEIKDLLNEAVQNFGIEIIDARIMRADLPKENSEAIHKRMQTEREKEARQIRAEGYEDSARIRSIADKKVKILLAESHKDAQNLKAEGDQLAAEIYNRAYNKNESFYKMHKALSSYRNAFEDGKTTFIIPMDSNFLNYLNFGSGFNKGLR